MVPSVSVSKGFNCSLGSVTKVSVNSSKVYDFHMCHFRQVVRGAFVTGGR